MNLRKHGKSHNSIIDPMLIVIFSLENMVPSILPTFSHFVLELYNQLEAICKELDRPFVMTDDIDLLHEEINVLLKRKEQVKKSMIEVS